MNMQLGCLSSGGEAGAPRPVWRAVSRPVLPGSRGPAQVRYVPRPDSCSAANDLRGVHHSITRLHWRAAIGAGRVPRLFRSPSLTQACTPSVTPWWLHSPADPSEWTEPVVSRALVNATLISGGVLA